MATNPLIEALLRRAQRGVGQINARGSAIGGALQPFAGQAAGYYSQIQGQEQALGGALNQSQATTGQQLGSGISSSLQGIQAPSQAVSQFGGGTATTGAQAGAAVGALSSADLQRLQSQGTAEQVYASALPRLAALAADQERRGFLEQMGQELTDKMADLEQQKVAQQYDEMWKQREWQYNARQDRLDRKSENRKWRYGVKQDRLDRQAGARATKLAERAAAAEYGLDYANQTADNATSAGNLTERERHNRQLEAQARERERRQREKDAKDKGSGDVVYGDIVASAKELGEPGENPKTGQATAHKVNKQEARRRLKAEFPGATPKQIERALSAAGY